MLLSVLKVYALFFVQHEVVACYDPVRVVPERLNDLVLNYLLCRLLQREFIVMHFFPFDFLSANELALDIFCFDHKLYGLHQIAIACVADVEAKTRKHACESHEA